MKGGGSGVDDSHLVLGPVLVVLLLNQLSTLRCSVVSDIVIGARYVDAGDGIICVGPPDAGAHPYSTVPAGYAGAGSNWGHVWSLPGLGTVIMLYMDITPPLWAGPLG